MRMLKALPLSVRGEGIISALYAMLLLTIIFFLGIDIAGYSATAWKLRNACSETLSLIKIENGYDSRMEEAFLRFAAVQGLETEKVRVSGTPKTVQRGDPVEIDASIPYEIRSVRPFNQRLSVEIKIRLSGLAQEFIR